MSVYKIFDIFTVLFLIQTCYTKPIDENRSLASKRNLRDYTIKHFSGLTVKCMYEYADITLKLLADKSLDLHDESEILQFKQNATKFIEEFSFTNIDYLEGVVYYLELTEEQLTPESKFIVELLEKYKYRELREDLIKETQNLIADFKTKFEEVKIHLGPDDPLLEWYGEFLSSEDQQVMAIEKFLQLTEY
ncbi:uncharacterized protein LOC119615620 [Lucilia sericata]|uniref:uncharacterized protein LOC119615620 n=1 Tax=Lucilia sericata TaxID=13632 RepID=UPI0018A812F0|nr:uncharacterized protein LOC119615620 [Lucilia sericata]